MDSRSARTGGALFAVVFAFACGGARGGGATGGGGDGPSATSASAGGGGPSSSGEVSAASTSGSGGSGGAQSSTSSSTSTSGQGGSSAPGLASLGALAVLGDSISDGGGQAPFYYDLLKQDLSAKYGAIAYHNNAQSGSTTSSLLGQAQALPHSLPGPVAVVITSGGNDMKAAIAAIVTGTDAGVRAMVSQNIQAALGELLAPGRFGAGVEVHVFEGNIYDASDGAGDFSAHNCKFGKGLPALPTDGFFKNWNDAIAAPVSAAAQASVDMHASFYGHGYKASPDWYASDCTHPSQVGHDQLHKLFYEAITGIALP